MTWDVRGMMQPGKYYAGYNVAYWSWGTAQAPASLSISGYNTPPATHTYGKCFGIYGTVTSGSKITSVNVGVFNSAGSRVTGVTQTPNSTSYSITSADPYVLFNKLSVGTYYYRIIATDVAGSKTLVDVKFTVK
jgi:hypothetical protein